MISMPLVAMPSSILERMVLLCLQQLHEDKEAFPKTCKDQQKAMSEQLILKNDLKIIGTLSKNGQKLRQI